jgi:hypothetical protein
VHQRFAADGTEDHEPRRRLSHEQQQEVGDTPIEMPVTPERVWRTIHSKQ